MVLPLAGKLSEGFGRKRIYLLSIALFTLASLGCGLAPTLTEHPSLGRYWRPRSMANFHGAVSASARMMALVR